MDAMILIAVLSYTFCVFGIGYTIGRDMAQNKNDRP